jgi:hypothetical protein
LHSQRFHQLFTDPSLSGAIAREVVDFYGDGIGEHPVGTGPFRLAEWRRSSRMVLERNPTYREVLYDEHPPAGDARREAIAAKLKGRRMPLVDRVEIAVIEEPQPRWLSFLSDEQDVVERIPDQFCEQAIPNGQLAPHLAKRGIQMVRYQRNDVSVSYFAMENPVVGGYARQSRAAPCDLVGRRCRARDPAGTLWARLFPRSHTSRPRSGAMTRRSRAR